MNTLVLKFKNKAGKNSTLRIPNVKDGLTKVEADTLMNLILTTNIFYVGDQELESAESSEVNSTVVLA